MSTVGECSLSECRMVWNEIVTSWLFDSIPDICSIVYRTRLKIQRWSNTKTTHCCRALTNGHGGMGLREFSIALRRQVRVMSSVHHAWIAWQSRGLFLILMWNLSLLQMTTFLQNKMANSVLMDEVEHSFGTWVVKITEPANLCTVNRKHPLLSSLSSRCCLWHWRRPSIQLRIE